MPTTPMETRNRWDVVVLLHLLDTKRTLVVTLTPAYGARFVQLPGVMFANRYSGERNAIGCTVVEIHRNRFVAINSCCFCYGTSIGHSDLVRTASRLSCSPELTRSK